MNHLRGIVNPKCCQNQEAEVVLGLVCKIFGYCAGGSRCRGGMTQIQAYKGNCGNHPVKCKPSTLKEQISKALSRDVDRWGGGIRSSVEASVMGVERRGAVKILFIFDNWKQDELR